MLILDLIQEINDHNRLYDKFDETHGRLTRRRYFSYDATELPNISEWSGAKSIIAVEIISSKINVRGKISAEWPFYLSSHDAKNPKLPDYSYSKNKPYVIC